MSIFDQFITTILRHRMLKPKEKILLGISGGPDSLAMLFLFDELRRTWGVKIYVAHLNHGLRREASQDAAFVKRVCERLNLPFIGQWINVRQLFKNGSTEENCRKARLDFLIHTAKKVKAKTIGLGHTKDDQAETILMRLLRGSGLLGLSGIIPRRDIKGLTFIRPLIEIERADIERYLKGHKLKPRRDLTNRDSVFFRNRIRNRLLPYLIKNYNRRAREVLSSAAQIISADYDYLRQQGEEALRQSAAFTSRTGRINLKKFIRFHPAIQRMVVRLSIEKIKGDTRRLTFQHWKEIEALIFSRRSGATVNLPGPIILKKYANALTVVLTNT